MSIIEALWYKHRSSHLRFRLRNLEDQLALADESTGESEAVYMRMKQVAKLINRVKIIPMADLEPRLFVWEPPTCAWMVASDTLEHTFVYAVPALLPSVWSAQDGATVWFVGDTDDDLIGLLELAMEHDVVLWSSAV